MSPQGVVFNSQRKIKASYSTPTSGGETNSPGLGVAGVNKNKNNFNALLNSFARFKEHAPQEMEQNDMRMVQEMVIDELEGEETPTCGIVYRSSKVKLNFFDRIEENTNLDRETCNDVKQRAQSE